MRDGLLRQFFRQLINILVLRPVLKVWARSTFPVERTGDDYVCDLLIWDRLSPRAAVLNIATGEFVLVRQAGS